MKMTCPNCNKQFEPKNSRQIYCKQSCKVSAWQKKKGIEKPEFLGKTDSISGTYEFVTKERQIPEYIDNPEYLQALNIYEGYVKKISFLRKKKNDCLKTLSTIVSTKTGALLGGSMGALFTGLITDSAGGAIIGGFIGALLGNEIEKSNTVELMTKVHKLEKHIFEIERQISTYELAKTIQFNHLKKLPKKLLEMVKETYQEKVLIELPLTPISKPEPEAILLENEFKTAKNVVSLTDFKEMAFPTLNFSGKWLEHFGNPQGNFRMMIYGASGHGKSYFTAQLAEYLANHHGRVLYNAAEEGLNKSLQLKMSSLDSKYIDISSYKNFEELKKNIKKYRFVIIDSINEMNLKPNELKQIWELDKKRGIIYIMQVTKQGTFKGDNQFKHDADIIVNIENRLPNIEKNRYN